MPFTLAHPAAILPLRRYCPRFLSFPALVIGSVSPDAGYLFKGLNLEGFSHCFVGSFAFDLPVGVLMLVLFYWLRAPVVGLIPQRSRQVFLPLCQRPPGSPLVAVLSLLIGTWTHLLWDSFTHRHGWLVEHLSILQTPIMVIGWRTLRIHNVIWYGCSFAGVVWLWFAYERWKQDFHAATPVTPFKVKLRDAVLIATVLVPLEAMHHLISGLLGLCLVGVSSALLVVWSALRVGDSQPRVRGKKA
jgi:hypothetical protein